MVAFVSCDRAKVQSTVGAIEGVKSYMANPK